MTLQSSGAISFADIKDEFGGSTTNGIRLSDYYGAATSVPRSGGISMSSFHGKSNYFVAQHEIFESGKTPGHNHAFGVSRGPDDGTVYVTGSFANSTMATPVAGYIAKHDGAGVVWARHLEMATYPYTWGSNSGGPYIGQGTRFVKSCSDSSGVYVGGESRGWDKGKGCEQLCLVKYNHSGTLQWVMAIKGGPVSDGSAMSVADIVVDDDYVYLVGGVGSRTDLAYRFKLDLAYIGAFNKSTGALAWKRHVDRDRMFVGAHVFNDGYIYLCLQDTRRGSVLKYSTSGTFQWAKQYGYSSRFRPHCMVGDTVGATKYLWLAGEGRTSYEAGRWLKIDTNGNMKQEGTFLNFDMPLFSLTRRMVHAAVSNASIYFLWNVSHRADSSSNTRRGLVTKINQSTGACEKQIAFENITDTDTPSQYWGGINIAKFDTGIGSTDERYLAMVTQSDDTSGQGAGKYQNWIIKIPLDLHTQSTSSTYFTYSKWKIWNLTPSGTGNSKTYTYSTYDLDPATSSDVTFYGSSNESDYSSSLTFGTVEYIAQAWTSSGVTAYRAGNAGVNQYRKTNIDQP